MLQRDLRRLQTRQAAITRRQIAQFLAWAVRHACARADLIGRPMTELVLAQAEEVTKRELAELADRGAFLFFGIRSSFELGDVPIRLTKVMNTGIVVVANSLEVHDWIMRGGSRGRGWKAPGELTVDDLAV